ncbi:25S rRNA (adenine645-N1)-methyltransferase [Trapelia coarctata]|nr:25S rRNA (adenine645-N1)-methyltransferase [Trapelia coarctata]
MFAVPGWSVAADSLKTQAPSSVTSKAPKATVNGDNESSAKSSKMRKRSKGKAGGVEITEENFEDLWKRHIEGKNLSKEDGKVVSAGLTKREKKKRKRDGDAGSGVSRNGTAEGAMDEVEEMSQSNKQEAEKSKAKDRKPMPVAGGESVKPPSTANRPTNTTGLPQPELSQTEKSKVLSNITPHPPPNTAPNSTLTPLQQAMREKLISSRFRYLNETLYTTPSTSSFDLFKQNPTFFTEYHEGFRRQVGVWPENPVDGFLKWIRERGAIGIYGSKLGSQKSQFKKTKKGKKGAENIHEGPQHTEPDAQGVEPLPRDSRSSLCTIADLGCGDAQLAQKLSSPVDTSKGPIMIKPLNIRVHSFDLAAPSPLITIADIRSVPLPDSSVDVTIFCLALMGTNWIEFIEEAWRILRWKGECWIGEVGSRFVLLKPKRVDHSVGNHSKPKPKKNNKKDQARSGIEEDLAEDEDLLAESSQPASRSSTDVSAFVEVLRTRGFTLIGEPELGNKMFVRMRFLKSLNPIKGKCVLKESDPRRGVWRSDGGRDVQKTTEGERQTWNKPSKFIDRNRNSHEAMSVEEEGKVLKPCVYKAR